MQVLIVLDDETHRRLERVAPAKSRKRSAFIREAIRKSLWDLEEERTRQAFLQAPDSEPLSFDPAVWEPLPFGGFDPPASRRARKLRVKRGARSDRAAGNQAGKARNTRSKRAGRSRKPGK